MYPAATPSHQAAPNSSPLPAALLHRSIQRVLRNDALGFSPTVFDNLEAEIGAPEERIDSGNEEKDGVWRAGPGVSDTKDTYNDLPYGELKDIMLTSEDVLEADETARAAVSSAKDVVANTIAKSDHKL